MSPNMAASGGDCRLGSATGIPSIPGYTRTNRWSKNEVLDRVFEHLQQERILRIKLEVLSIDSTVVKVHPDGTGALISVCQKTSQLSESKW